MKFGREREPRGRHKEKGTDVGGRGQLSYKLKPPQPHPPPDRAVCRGTTRQSLSLAVEAMTGTAVLVLVQSFGEVVRSHLHRSLRVKDLSVGD